MQPRESRGPECYGRSVPIGSRWLAVAVAAALALVGVPRPVPAGTASMAEQLEGEDAECRFLIFLCRQANVATKLVERVPPGDGTELLAIKRNREARLRMRDATEAARVIAAKHPADEQPWCLEDQECAFLKDDAGKR
jgi:hypothetical protein